MIKYVKKTFREHPAKALPKGCSTMVEHKDIMFCVMPEEWEGAEEKFSIETSTHFDGISVNLVKLIRPVTEKKLRKFISNKFQK